MSFYSTIKQGVDNINLYESVLSLGLNSYFTKEIDQDKINIQNTITNIARYVFMQSFPVVEGVSSDNAEISQQQTDAQELLNTQYHNGQPLVVIYHTHTTESFYDENNPTTYRSTDPTKNLISIGHIVAQTLYQEYGIQVLHLTEVYDQPYDSAYDKSLIAVEKALEEYPSIQYAFDIHRDGLANTEDNFSVYQTEVNGESAARVMLVIGTTTETYQNNIDFATQIQNKMNEMYPDMFRKILERPYKYNQYVAPTTILFELGSNLSTLEEAKRTAVYLGRVLGELITQ